MDEMIKGMKETLLSVRKRADEYRTKAAALQQQIHALQQQQTSLTTELMKAQAEVNRCESVAASLSSYIEPAKPGFVPTPNYYPYGFINTVSPTYADPRWASPCTAGMRDDGNMVLDKSVVEENIPTNTTNIEKLD